MRFVAPSRPQIACAAAVLLFAVGARATPVGGSDPCRVDVRIEARYDEPTRHLDGTATHTFTNRTADRIRDLWFHLYLNAFSNTESTFLTETRGELRGKTVRTSELGWQRVTSVVCAGEELLPTLRYRHPDGVSTADRTVFSVDLPRAIGPGETVEIRVAWESKLPRVRRRTGYKDEFLLVAHWFPKLGVYEEGRGWNCHEFHAEAQFYASYGTYDVTLDLPSKYEGKVFATGVQITPSERRGDRMIARFVAPSPHDQTRVDASGRTPLVHDFTWTADPRFKAKHATFHSDAWLHRFPDEVELVQRALGPRAQLALRDVEVWVLMQPEREKLWTRHFEAACATLFFYGLWYGEYPYERLTIVDPRWGAEQAGGMEHPCLFTVGSSLFDREEAQRPESTIVHEAGHQWWYGLVGNNEFEASWLDEGLDSYADAEVIARRFGRRRASTTYAGIPVLGVPPAPAPGGGVFADLLSAQRIPIPLTGFDLTPLRRSGFVDWWRDQPPLSFVETSADARWADRGRYLQAPNIDPIDTFGWLYAPGASYRTNTYQRPAVALRSLPAVLGENGRELFLRGMRHFADTWRYGHPYPEDFFRAFSEGAGVDVSWYFEELFRGTATVDWSVTVTQHRTSPARGSYQSDPMGSFVERAQARDESHGETSDSGDPNQPWRAEIVVVRDGELRLPLPIRWTFDDGATGTRVWTREEQAGERWLRIEIEDKRKLKSVVLDPERGYFLDLDMRDNSWFDEVDRVAPLRWAERAFTRYAHLLHWQGGLGG
jgi:hypothetical protein